MFYDRARTSCVCGELRETAKVHVATVRSLLLPLPSSKRRTRTDPYWMQPFRASDRLHITSRPSIYLLWGLYMRRKRKS